MIEINLLPGAARRPARRSRRSSRSSFSFAGKLPAVDRWAASIAAGWVVGPAAIVWLFLGTSGRIDELGASIDEAVRDSTRYASLIQAQLRLRARRDTIAQKLEIIQEIDADRYVWPHILDEISRALPEYTWLIAVRAMDVSDPDATGMQIVGRTGNTFALTRFMNDLEDSPFIRGVKINMTEQVRDAEDRVVHQFILHALYEEPLPELIDMVPLFDGQE